jgi:hypothetical protein
MLALYDAGNLLLVASEGSRQYPDTRQVPKPGGPKATQWEPFAVQTLDGGNKWTGLEGEQEKERTYLHMLGAVSDCMTTDQLGGAIICNEDGCPSALGPRHRVQVLTFLGKKGWTGYQKECILDAESLHCSHGGPLNMLSVVRLPSSGKLWAALVVQGRLVSEENPNFFEGVHAKYSDNNGKSWYTWKEGLLARIPESSAKDDLCGKNPQIVPYGEHVAVFWSSKKWSFFDGDKWSPPQPTPGPFHSVVPVGEKAVLIAGGKGVHRLENGNWTSELAADPGTLCLAGKTVLAFATGPGKSAIELRRRSAEGAWGAAQVFNTGAPIAGRNSPGQVLVPRFCPANLGAIAYMTADDDKSVKVLLVPSK